MEVGICIYCNS